MKHILILLSLVILVFSCTTKTEENSKYAGYISDLKRFQAEVDSVKEEFSKINIDSVVAIRKSADTKYGAVKKVYQTDKIDTKYEKIMLLVRGQLVKKLRTVESDFMRLNNDYSLSKKKYLDLKEDLINESWDDEKAKIYFNEERNAQILLNGEMSGFISNVNSSMELAPKLNFQIDSIIAEHE
jgi:hypothetical protein